MAAVLPSHHPQVDQVRVIDHAPLDDQTPASIGQPQPEAAARPRVGQAAYTPGAFPGTCKLAAFQACSSERTIYRRFRFRSSVNLADLESELEIVQ